MGEVASWWVGAGICLALGLIMLVPIHHIVKRWY